MFIRSKTYCSLTTFYSLSDVSSDCKWSRRSVGSIFQNLAPAIVKFLFPTLLVLVTARQQDSADRRCCRLANEVTWSGHSQLPGMVGGGVSPCRHKISIDYFISLQKLMNRWITVNFTVKKPKRSKKHIKRKADESVLTENRSENCKVYSGFDCFFGAFIMT